MTNSFLTIESIIKLILSSTYNPISNNRPILKYTKYPRYDQNGRWLDIGTLMATPIPTTISIYFHLLLDKRKFGKKLLNIILLPFPHCGCYAIIHDLYRKERSSYRVRSFFLFKPIRLLKVSAGSCL